MFEGQRRLLHVAQRNIAQEELGFGKRVSFDQAMLLDDAIGEFGVAAGENPSGNRLPFRPPGRRADEIVGLGEQNLDCRIGHVLFAAPAQLLEDEPRIRAQLRRNPRRPTPRHWRLARRAPSEPRPAGGSRTAPVPTCGAPPRSVRPTAAGRSAAHGPRAEAKRNGGRENSSRREDRNRRRSRRARKAAVPPSRSPEFIIISASRTLPVGLTGG